MSLFRVNCAWLITVLWWSLLFNGHWAAYTSLYILLHSLIYLQFLNISIQPQGWIVICKFIGLGESKKAKF